MVFATKSFAKVLAKVTMAVSALMAGDAAIAANNDPIVLVHGFLGFGPHELRATGFKY